MGIKGLLELLKPCFRQRSMREYSGKCIAVDTYSWLHKLIKGPSSREFLMGNRDKFVQDVMRRVGKLLKEGIKLVMVFDGGMLPRKQLEEETRRKRREQHMERAQQMIANGNQGGYNVMVGAIDITPDIAYRLIEALRSKGVAFIVAPYEADAQLAYLSRAGFVDLVLTEDSDLLVFGAKKVLYKFDPVTMSGLEIELDNIRTHQDLPFYWYTHCMFMTVCIISKCDYLAQVAGVGLKTALKIITRVNTCAAFLDQCGQKAPPNYYEDFIKAFLTFRFQRVYCPRAKQCIELNPFSMLTSEQKQCSEWSKEVINPQIVSYLTAHPFDNYDFLGTKHPSSLSQLIAQAHVHPITYLPYESVTATIAPLLNFPKLSKKTKRPDYSQQALSLSLFINKSQKKPLSDKLISQFQSNNNHAHQQKEASVNFQSLLHKRPLLINSSPVQSSQQEMNLQISEANSFSNICLDVNAIQQFQSGEQLKQTVSLKQQQNVKVLFNENMTRLLSLAEKLFEPVFSQQFLANPLKVSL